MRSVFYILKKKSKLYWILIFLSSIVESILFQINSWQFWAVGFFSFCLIGYIDDFFNENR